MLGLLHGEAGGWDELAIAVAAFGVLWLAVKLAGRKPAAEDEPAVLEDSAVEGDGSGDSRLEPEERLGPQEPGQPAPPPAAKR